MLFGLRGSCLLLQLVPGLDQVGGVDGFAGSKTPQGFIDVHKLGDHLGTQGLGGSGDELDQLVPVIATTNGFQACHGSGVDKWRTALALRESRELALFPQHMQQPTHQGQL